jgi:cytoskeletal protein RodZ
MNYDVNMVEEIARLDALQKGRRGLLYLVPLVLIFALVMIFWFVPELFSSFTLQSLNWDVQTTEQATPSQRQSTATEIQSSPAPSSSIEANSSAAPTITPVNTLDAVAATRESQAWAVQNAIRGNR